MERKAWFCPSCQKHHAPHVETCPAPTGAQPAPAPAIPGIIPYQPPREWYPDPTGTPWKPYWTPVTCGDAPVVSLGWFSTDLARLS